MDGSISYILHIAGACCAVYLAVCFLFSRTHLYRCVSKLPCPSWATWIRTLRRYKWKEIFQISIAPRLVNDVGRLYEKEGIFCFWQFFRPYVFVFKPEIFAVLLSDSTNIRKMREMDESRLLFGSGLFNSYSSLWRNRRSMIRPSFHINVLENSIPAFHERSMVAVTKMLADSDKPFIDIRSIMTLCALDIFCEAALGVQIEAQTEKYSRIPEIFEKTEEYVTVKYFKPQYWGNILNYFGFNRRVLKDIQIIHGMVENIVKQKKNMMKAEMDNTPKEDFCSKSMGIKKRKPLLESLLEQHMNDESFTELDVINEVKTVILAHNSTPGALSFALHSIGLFPEVQEKIIEEIDSIFGEDANRPITFKDLKLMNYTERVIKESLRLYPTIPIFGREIEKDITIDDYVIAAGSTCIALPFLLHRNPEIFPDPKKFDPDRFLPENCAGRHPFAHLPFSAGPRSCPGQNFALLEEKTVLANIFRNMRVTSLDARDKFPVTATFTLKAARALRVRVLPRNSREKRATD